MRIIEGSELHFSHFTCVKSLQPLNIFYHKELLTLDIYVIITDATSDIASQQFLQKTTMFMNNVNLYQGSEYVQFHFKKFNSVGGSTVHKFS